MCWRVLPRFLAISSWICTVLTVMKRGDEALNASSLQFLSIVKCFIVPIFFSALNASSLLLFMEKHRLMLHRRYFLKENSSLNVSSPLLFKVTLPLNMIFKS
jgi:hypothetical protein